VIFPTDPAYRETPASSKTRQKICRAHMPPRIERGSHAASGHASRKHIQRHLIFNRGVACGSLDRHCAGWISGPKASLTSRRGCRNGRRTSKASGQKELIARRLVKSSKTDWLLQAKPLRAAKPDWDAGVAQLMTRQASSVPDVSGSSGIMISRRRQHCHSLAKPFMASCGGFRRPKSEVLSAVRGNVGGTKRCTTNLLKRSRWAAAEQ